MNCKDSCKDSIVGEGSPDHHFSRLLEGNTKGAAVHGLGLLNLVDVALGCRNRSGGGVADGERVRSSDGDRVLRNWVGGVGGRGGRGVSLVEERQFPIFPIFPKPNPHLRLIQERHALNSRKLNHIACF